jgi:hypothetical protein
MTTTPARTHRYSRLRRIFSPNRDKAPAALDVSGAVSAQFDYLDKIVEQLTDAQHGYWDAVWKTAVIAAAAKIATNRQWFYRLQGTTTATAVIVPALVGLNLNGTGGEAVRWSTFAVGLTGAMAAAALQLFRFGSRWRLNRDYYTELVSSGRTFAMQIARSPDATCTGDEWDRFQQDTDQVIARYNNLYDTEVISATQPGTPPLASP